MNPYAELLNGPDPPLYGGQNPDPSWLVWESTNPVLRASMRELLNNPRFRAHVDSAVAPAGKFPFTVHVADRAYLDKLNAHPDRRGKYRIRPAADMAGVSMFAVAPDSSSGVSSVAIDVDRLHREFPDSAKARLALRDALLHEFAHVLPVARSRHMRDRTFDPPPDMQNVADHPVIKGENLLRALIGLPAKDYYGLRKK
jgi:hypothetical protein